MLKKYIKNKIKPFALPIYNFYCENKNKLKQINVPISKLLRGGENGIRAAKYAELTNNFLRPSTSVYNGPHLKFLQLYEQIGDNILQNDILQTTDYYKNALECMNLTGSYFYDIPEKIKVLAERFIKQHKGEKLNLPEQPGQSSYNQPVWVRPIKFSSCYEIIDGNHRIARAIMRGEDYIKVFVYEKEAVLTPLQQLLLDCLWINKQKWLYQPVNADEIKDSWILVRNCEDRWQMMYAFLKQQHMLSKNFQKSYLDIGSSYGWFVKKMQDIGFNSFGMERDPFGMQVGFKVYDVNVKQIIHSDIILGLEKEQHSRKKYDVVSCLSVLHHFVLGKSSMSAEFFIKLLDSVTDQILFLDTGEEHEAAFNGKLNGWNIEFIQKWITEHSTFSKVICLGKDQDRKKPFEGYYNRTLFACLR